MSPVFNKNDRPPTNDNGGSFCIAVATGIINTSSCLFCNCHNKDKRSEIKSLCGEKCSYGKVSQSGKNATRKCGAKKRHSPSKRRAFSAVSVKTNNGYDFSSKNKGIAENGRLSTHFFCPICGKAIVVILQVACFQ